MDDYLIEALDRTRHVRDQFSCGVQPLDDFLKTRVGQYEKRRLGRTFVITRSGGSIVLGYYTLASGSMDAGVLPEETAKKLPKHPVPVVLLGRLAVDVTTRGQGLGRRLLANAFQRIIQISQQLGVYAVTVDAIGDESKAFYLKYGFIPLIDDPLHLFLPLATLEQALPG